MHGKDRLILFSPLIAMGFLSRQVFFYVSFICSAIEVSRSLKCWRLHVVKYYFLDII